MKIIRSQPGKGGKIRLTVELDADEELLATRSGAYYKLGYPVEDIVQSHVLQDSRQVTWCSIEQRWVE